MTVTQAAGCESAGPGNSITDVPAGVCGGWVDATN
jgi:hypothetical protein